MPIDNPNQIQAAEEMADAICSGIATGQGIHAETAVSAAGRLAGTLLLRSSGLPVAQWTPGASIFSDEVDEQGQALLEAVGETLDALEVQLDPDKIDYDVPDANAPQLNLQEMQERLEAPLQELVAKFGLEPAAGAETAAMSAAFLIQRTAGVLPPEIGYALVANGLVEGCKTVPMAPAAVTPDA